MDHAGFVPTHNVCASQSTLLRLQVALQGNCPKWALSCMHFPGLICSGSGSWVLHKGTDFVGPAFCALPGPRSSGDQVLGDRTLPGGLCILITSQVPALGFLGVPVRALSQVCHVSPLRSWSQAVTLLADVNHPGSQEDLVINWEPVTVWWRMLSLGQDCPLPSGSGCCLPAPLLLEEGGACLQLASFPLIIAQTFVLWALEKEMARRKWQSTPVLLPGKSHGQRSLVSYSPWGRKELELLLI